MHGGIWTLCIDLTDGEMQYLGRYGFPYATKCISYLAENAELQRHDEYSIHGDGQLPRRPSISKSANIPYFLLFSAIPPIRKCVIVTALLFARNAKSINILFAGVPNNFGKFCIAWCLWGVSATN